MVFQKGHPGGPGRKKKKILSEREQLWLVAEKLMGDTDVKNKYKGAMLALKIKEKAPRKEFTVVDPFVMSLVELFQTLSDEMGISGEEVIARLGEQISNVEQLIRREMS